jgi:hypothetical protein
LIKRASFRKKEADSLRAEAAIASQADLSKVKSSSCQCGKKIQFRDILRVRYQILDDSGQNRWGSTYRRARLDVKGSISPYWGYRVQFDLAGVAKLIDAYAELKLNDYFNFTLGQATNYPSHLKI